MTIHRQQKIWCEQCKAAGGIKQRYGLRAAMDYLIGEKLLNHATAAASHREFARELPAFVVEVRRIFNLVELRDYLERIEREAGERSLLEADIEDDAMPGRPSDIADRRERFATIKELLLEARLGTS